jgi:hypothetical protein
MIIDELKSIITTLQVFYLSVILVIITPRRLHGAIRGTATVFVLRLVVTMDQFEPLTYLAAFLLAAVALCVSLSPFTRFIFCATA